MDIQMVRVSGFEATKAIRGLELTGEINPIKISAFTSYAEERHKCFSIGMDYFLIKPPQPLEL